MTISVSTCSIDLPDIAVAFSHHWCKCNETGTNTTVTVTGAGITLECFLNYSDARFSLLPIIRQAQTVNLLGNLGDSPWGGTIGLTIKTYEDGALTGTGTTSIEYIFGAIGTDRAYSVDRYITFNPTFGGKCTLLTNDRTGEIDPQNVDTDFPDEALFQQWAETFNGKLRNYDISAWLKPSFTRAVVTIDKDYIRGVECGNETQGDYVKIYVTADTRKNNIRALRWLDPTGCEWLRVFALSGEELTVNTNSEYTEPDYNHTNSPYDPGDKIWQDKTGAHSLTLGDDNIPMEQLDWIRGLLLSSYVDMVYLGGKTQRVNVADASLSVDPTKHVFSVSMKIVLPEIKGQEW